ncbi:MAG: EAL domain-containing protein [Magnetococcales bacterium]|nr:EAL domain-containing protein [Magnetococcales bacterium]
MALSSDTEKCKRISDDLLSSQEHLNKVQEIAHLGSWSWDILNNTLLWSDEAYRIFGLSPTGSFQTYEAFIKSVHREDRAKLKEAVKSALADPDYRYELEHRVVRPDGSERVVMERGKVEWDSFGKPISMMGTVHDITNIRSVEDQLKLVQIVLNSSDEGVFISDSQNKIISVNQSLCKLYGYDSAEMLGQRPSIFKSDRQDKEFYTELWQTLVDKDEWTGEMWNRRKNGETFPVKTTIQAVRNKFGEVSNFVCIYKDLSDIKQRDEELVYSTTHDVLTSLPNRQLFLDRLRQAIRQAHREDSRVSVSVLNIDLFKKINDSLGHTHGDELLKMIAQRLKNSVRQEDTVSRLGGDEFSIIHPNAGNVEAVALMMQRIFDGFAKPFYLAGKEFYITLSTGITLYPEDGMDPDKMLRNADLAMNRAKDVGRSNFQFFTSTLDDRATNRLTIENDMRLGLKRGEFFLNYQPKVDLSTGQITGMESLSRWKPSGKDQVSPVEFIPIAEETGLIVPLGDFILRDACFQTKNWLDINPNLRVAVNLSASQFRQKNLLMRLDSALRDSGLPPEKLEIEITESMLVDNIDEVINILCKIKERGITIAMDDFGTGYSSLSVLKRFPLDTLKIDQSFVRDLTVDSDDAQIVTAIISMAKSLHLKVVAEGVETKEQLMFLTERECDMMQGYYFSKPLVEDDFSALLTQKKSLLDIG